MFPKFGKIWLAVFALAASAAFAAPPNFVIFIGDDVGWNDHGCYGHPHIKTPNVDRMAKNGMRFDNAFLTISSCSPSRCSILTGRYPHNTNAGNLHDPLPADQVMISSLLRKQGYYTASSGKWHLGNAVRKQFDRIEDKGGASGCEKWLPVVKERPKDQPFFFWFAASDAHRGWSKNAIPEPHTAEQMVVPPFLPDNAATRQDLARYADEVSRLDDYVGKVIAELTAQGQLDNTLFIYISDNGRPFPRCKTTVYDSGIKTPFVAYWKNGIAAPGICRSMVSVIDIAPTLLELAGSSASVSFQGSSMAGMFKDPSVSIREHIFAEHNWHDFQAHERAVRSKDFLYIRNAFPQLTGSPPADAVRSPTYQSMIDLESEGKLPEAQRGCFMKPRPREELYDVNQDPFQLNNLAGESGQAEQLEVLRDVLDAWIIKTKDKVPDPPRPDTFHRMKGTKLQ